MKIFNFFKRKSSPENDLSALITDMHSHILPGIDDGSPDLETSLELVQGLQDLGYQKLIASPHILWDMYKNDQETIAEAQNLLQHELGIQNSKIQISSAAEYYMDEHFDELVQQDKPLLTIRDNWVLVEFSFVSPPLDLKEKIFDLQVRGYQPVIAHPERYLYFAENRSWYDDVSSAGAYLQINLLSLAGYYGKGALELARYIYKRRLTRLLGTDLHHERHLNALRRSTGMMNHVKEILDSNNILNPQL